MDQESKDFIEEQKRVDFVIEEIERKEDKLARHAHEIKERVIDLRKSFWDDVTVNIDDPDDIIETQASIKQQAELLSERERSHGQLSEELKTLKRLKDSPYFGRIDFLEDGEKKTDNIYIGISSLMDTKDEDFLIYDWRAPISSLYYDYPPGPAQYDTVDGSIDGEMKLKRQFIIRNGYINGMFNTGLTIGDHLLQSVLGDNASVSMKSIVATIQKEQNQIIRNDKSKLLIVQGVAGSGKTSAALQRVAYLLYRYREILTSENIILFSPNPLFNSYVATVLPELGEENMKQTTFQEHVEERLGNQYDIETPFEQMEYYLTGDDHNSEYEARVEGIRFKASLVFKKWMDDYLEYLSSEGIIFRNIKFRGERILTKGQIEDYFYGLDSSISIANRMELVRDWIVETLNKLKQKEIKQDWVLEELDLMEKEDYVNAFQQLEKGKQFTEDSFDDFEREEELLREMVVTRKLTPLRKKVKALSFVNVHATFMNFFQRWSHENKSESEPTNWYDICKQTVSNMKQKVLAWEDVSPYLYLQDHILGFLVNRTIRHVFIDEAQDYSPFQFAYIKEKYPYSRVTLLGDYNQAIYAHTYAGETLLSPTNENESERITLTRSYRSTKEIVDFTKDLITGGEVIEPFNREGTKPSLCMTQNENVLVSLIVEKLKSLREKGYETIAVICKTMEESERAYNQLKDYLPIKFMDQNTKTFQKGLIVIPAYLAKGIEFDSVIIYNASEENYCKEIERNLFYTACTRAMHELIMFSHGTPSTFIQAVSDEKYILTD
ncbi:DNA helicase-2/ATP-dependent DNA helicase PcrA [Salirhabdus euzebyi]|uniref:DNA helicase-2/ATP-dependent DNA helicase PcrA n=1 Tax=Salirhabdus euzebyi TaxID=394506 RepID=A0A841Q609_9BACI|nr:RNA polymerase recycling motor HelD [Salirhabdus euzebyi]MBB6453787.1 DNA helicase-2/ATP-dependent DNA helicase PcrA [Salirhabdus euzebyi]